MQSDGFSLFTECHRLYVLGVRRALSERLMSAYGDDWWERGVRRAISEDQRRNIDIVIERDSPEDLSGILDTLHFGRIIARNHAAAFADVFPDLDITLKHFRNLSSIRNEWAHIPEKGLELPAVKSAIQSIQFILVSLRCREALEIEKMSQSIHEQSDSTEQEPMTASSDDSVNDEHGDEIDEPEQEPATTSLGDSVHDQVELAASEQIPVVNDDPLGELAASPLALWSDLQSYLVLESFVQTPENPDEDSNRSHSRNTTVIVRVSNMAPISEGRPDIFFKSVKLEVLDRGSLQSLNIGSLESGKSIEKEFKYYEKELATVEFRVSGDLDTNRLFQITQKGGLPSRVVKPLLKEVAKRFHAIGIKEPMEKALTTIAAVQPSMTLADASVVRKKLAEIPPMIEDKVSALQDLFHEFHLNKQSRLGAQCHEVWLWFRELGAKIQAVDDAIGETNPELINQAAHDLEQLQLSVLQVEETFRTLTRD